MAAEVPNSWLPDDVLNRKQYADFLTKILSQKQDSFVLNINARWGDGKTFFIKKWMKDLSAGQKHPTIYFNAWENDFGGDSLAALLSVIDEQLSVIPKIEAAPPMKLVIRDVVSSGGNLIKAAAPVLLKGLANKFLGIDSSLLKSLADEDKEAISEALKVASEDYIESHKEALKQIVNFKEKLNRLVDEIRSVSGIELPLYIFIDELDRCRPLYSIELLEKLKHVLSVPGIVFIVATDTAQLSHSVKAIYGEQFDGDTYLRRFFDLEYHLPDPSCEEYANFLCKKYSYDKNPVSCYPDLFQSTVLIPMFFSSLSRIFQLSLRDQEQCFARFDAIRMNLGFNERLHIFYLLFLIMLHRAKGTIFEDYFNINVNPSKLYDEEFSGRLNKTFIKTCNMHASQLHDLYWISYAHEFDYLKSELAASERSADKKDYPYKVEIYHDHNFIKKYRDKVRLVGGLS